jgi:hypothetical protein
LCACRNFHFTGDLLPVQHRNRELIKQAGVVLSLLSHRHRQTPHAQ